MVYPKYAANKVSGTSLKATSVTIRLSVARKACEAPEISPKCMAPIVGHLPQQYYTEVSRSLNTILHYKIELATYSKVDDLVMFRLGPHIR